MGVTVNTAQVALQRIGESTTETSLLEPKRQVANVWSDPRDVDRKETFFERVASGNQQAVERCPTSRDQSEDCINVLGSSKSSNSLMTECGH